MKNKYILIGMVLMCTTMPSFSQSSERVYTEEEVRQALRLASGECDCGEQKKRFTASSAGSFSIMITGGISYLYGSDEGSHSFSSDIIGLDGEVMLGYTYTNSRGGEGTSLGIFVGGGVLPQAALENLMKDGEINVSFAEQDDNAFYKVEGGAVIAGFFRVTTGLGFQEYRSEVNELKRISYYLTTPGILLGSPNVKLSIYVNILYGRDVEETVYKPGVGLALKF